MVTFGQSKAVTLDLSTRKVTLMTSTRTTDHQAGDRTIPVPDEAPTIPLWPAAGRAVGLGRSATYDAAARGDIPTIRLGRRIVVPTASLRRLLGMDESVNV